MGNIAWEESKRENTARKPHLELAALKEKQESDKKAGGPQHLYGLVAPAWLARQSVVPEPTARQSEKAGGPQHYGVTVHRAIVNNVTRRGPWPATLAPINALCHYGAPSRASACGATEWCNRATHTGATKRVRFANTFFRLVLKYCLKKIKF
jgi:hypothetical protein